MSHATTAPTHLDQIEEALEERQKGDRRQQALVLEEKIPQERRQQNRRDTIKNSNSTTT